MTTKAKKKKRGSTKPSQTQLRKKLWKYLSLYIKHRDGYRCITCDRYVSGANAHAGHFIPSSLCNLELRYDEDNIYCQCMRCNVHLSGNYVTYRERLVERNGEDWVVQLEQRRHKIVKDFSYEEKTKEYQQKLEGMGVQLP
jgi:5-methylcytosine-specific restriction endonuclease McrA